jgi:hypothetical protein
VVDPEDVSVLDPTTFEVLAVEGNTLVVRLPEGTRELTVADDFRFTIDGQQLSVRQLKAGDEGHGDHYHEDHDESRHRDRSEEWNRRDADGDVDHRAHR